MKKIILYGILAAVFAGCSINNQPEKNDEKKESKEIIKEDIKEVKKEEIYIPFTFYKIVPKQIEVFPYKKLYKGTIIDDTKLNDSFYVKGNYMRIENVFTSEIGDKYGKIVGKDLLVSMDDLTKSDRK